MANYPFKINITTKDGSKFSYYTGSFATDAESVVSASTISEKLLHSNFAAHQYTESIAAPADTITSEREFGHIGGGLRFLSSSYVSPNTGSITFTDTETSTNDGLDYYTFWGTKVCSVLGLPEGIPIYTENFKFSDTSAGGNYMSGDVIADGVLVKKHFKMSPQARVKGSLVWDEVFGEGFIQWASGSNTRMIMGYDPVQDSYRLDAPQITGSSALFGGVEASTYGGRQTTSQYISFAANDIEFHENGVDVMHMRDTHVTVNPDLGDVDFYAYSDDGTKLIHADAGANSGAGKVDMDGQLSLGQIADVSASIAT